MIKRVVARLVSLLTKLVGLNQSVPLAIHSKRHVIVHGHHPIGSFANRCRIISVAPRWSHDHLIFNIGQLKLSYACSKYLNIFNVLQGMDFSMCESPVPTAICESHAIPGLIVDGNLKRKYKLP